MAKSNPPLNIIIVGGGIGGFAAAIALRRQGHEIQVYEQSKLASEIGAAISILPNSDSILKRLGVDVGDCGGNQLKQIRYINSAGKTLQVLPVAKGAHRWQGQLRCTHRAHLHDHLKEVATSSEGIGPSVKLHSASKILNVDARNAIITLANGSKVKADALIGADGVHSVTRVEISASARAYKSHHSAFRFLVTRQAALEDPTTSAFASGFGSMDMWYAEDRKIVMYPCDNNDVLNFVCIHPAELSKTDDSGYDTSASKAKLLEVFKGFDPVVKAFLELAARDAIRVYPLFDMEQLPTFVKDRLALVGDAAHPFLPHLAQGGSMAIEDGVALSVMLPRGISPAAVPARLQLYNEARYERASRIQNFTRLAGRDGAKKGQESAEDFNVHDYLEQGMSHDEIHSATEVLRRHRWKQDANLHWRQPTAFGPMPGPQQPFGSTLEHRDGGQAGCQTASIVFKTSATLLRNLFPSPAFGFKERDTVAYASFRLQTLDKVPWLGGQGYHSLGFYIHDVVYTKRNGESVVGSYIPVMFEDLADPILSGREELGLPKLFCDFTMNRSEGRIAQSLIWRGAKWAKFAWDSLQESATDVGQDFENETLLTHKYIPATGRRQDLPPDADYAIMRQPQKRTRSQNGFSMGGKTLVAKKASFELDALDWQRLPTLHHIVSRLAELPVFEVVEGSSVVDSVGEPDFSGMERIE